jgi:hypothetical protein
MTMDGDDSSGTLSPLVSGTATPVSSATNSSGIVAIHGNLLQKQLQRLEQAEIEKRERELADREAAKNRKLVEREATLKKREDALLAEEQRKTVSAWHANAEKCHESLQAQAVELQKKEAILTALGEKLSKQTQENELAERALKLQKREAEIIAQERRLSVSLST